MNNVLMQVRDLVKHFPVRGGLFNRVVACVHAVNGVSFDIHRGETLGVVGESGCGKSTLGKMLVRLLNPTAGTLVYDGQDITTLNHVSMLPLRRRLQIIFQDPFSSLNPRMTVATTLAEGIRLHRIVPKGETNDYITDLLRQVGLHPEDRNQYPHEFSGGQRQRIGIARAIAVRPELLIADEPVSALDVSIQAQILNLLMDLRLEMGLTLLFISHDLKVIEHFCHRVLVMYLGNVVEELPCHDLANTAKHPYTQALLEANPINDPMQRKPLVVLEGEVPSPYAPPSGCPFTTRCAKRQPHCSDAMPPLQQYTTGHRVACFEVTSSMTR